MALPSSGAISLSAIASEFGDSTPNSISEFYRGGSLVPNVSINNSIPTSGAISFSNFYGATDQLWSVTITNGIVNLKFAAFYGYANNAVLGVGGGGSASDTTVDFLSGATLGGLYWSTFNVIVFAVAGTLSNTGFTTMTLGGVNYSRSSATFANTTSPGGVAYSTWSWTTSFTGSDNPFANTDGTTAASFI